VPLRIMTPAEWWAHIKPWAELWGWCRRQRVDNEVAEDLLSMRCFGDDA
jgi:hypothetical protein